MVNFKGIKGKPCNNKLQLIILTEWCMNNIILTKMYEQDRIKNFWNTLYIMQHLKDNHKLFHVTHNLRCLSCQALMDLEEGHDQHEALTEPLPKCNIIPGAINKLKIYEHCWLLFILPLTLHGCSRDFSIIENITEGLFAVWLRQKMMGNGKRHSWSTQWNGTEWAPFMLEWITLKCNGC